MSNDLLTAVTSFLSGAWHFFTDVTIPGTNITFAVMALGLAIVPIGFQFLSLMAGHNIGETGEVGGENYGHWTHKGKNAKISANRKNDVR